MVTTPSERPLPTALSKFTHRNWFWKWFWKRMSEVDLDFKWAASHFPHQISSAVAVVTMKIWSHQPSGNRFSKTLPASSMLNLSRESEDCLTFFFCQEHGYWQFQIKSHHMSKIFRSVLHGLLWAYALRQVSYLEIWQQTSLPRRWISNTEWQDYHRLENNSSPPNLPESTPEMVGLTTEICGTPSVRLRMRSIFITSVRGLQH